MKLCQDAEKRYEFVRLLRRGWGLKESLILTFYYRKCLIYQLLHNTLSQKLQVKTTISIYYLTQFLWVRNQGVTQLILGLRVSDRLKSRCWLGLKWGQRISFHDGSFTWLVSWAIGRSAHTDLTTWTFPMSCLSILTALKLVSPE